MAAYCGTEDLLVGDIGGLDGLKPKFIQMATDEIDGMLGFVYVLPLGGLSAHATLIIKNIARKLASGRLINSQATAGEDNQVHAYGQSLIDEAFRDLWAIRNGDTDLGVPKIASMQTSGDAPEIYQGDEFSGVDAFYAWMGSGPGYYRPTYGWSPGMPSV